MKLTDIIRHDDTRETVFVTHGVDGENRWRIHDDAGPHGWECVFSVMKKAGVLDTDLDDVADFETERHHPVYPARRPGWWTRRRLNRWRTEFEYGQRKARPPRVVAESKEVRARRVY